MKKLSSLRAALLAEPLGPRGGRLSRESLLTFAEKGTVRFRDGADSGAFELSYDAHVIAVEFAGDPLRLLRAVCRWLGQASPGTPEDVVKFHVDILDGGAVDVSILVPLTETATESAAGGVEAVADPDIAHVDLFLGLTNG